jgi:oxalate decarboxylase
MTVFFPVDNARTVDFNPNDGGYAPSNAGHYIENTGDKDAVFLEMLASDVFEDVSLNQWLRRLPAQMVQAHLGFDKASLAKIPDEKLVLL